MAYERINWKDEPVQTTPLSAVMLNRMDAELKYLDDTATSLNTTKANQSDLLQTVKTVAYNTTTGVFTFTFWNGSTVTVDLNVEKIPVSFSMSPQGIITMTTADGTTYTADVAELIKTYTFNDGDIIDFAVSEDSSGNKIVTADIKDGSITGEKLQPNYLADCENARDTTLAAKDIVEEDKQAILDALEETEGRLLVPRGEYDPEVEYHMLDLVYDNGSSYICKQTSTGNPTSDTDYWQIFAQALTSKMTATMTAGQTSVTFTSTSILPNSNIIVYTNVQGLMYNSIVYGTNTVTISFDEQVNDIDVQIVIIN